MSVERKKHNGGRPRKFREPSHPVTVTLPERILKGLEKIDSDRARAIVKATDSVLHTIVDKEPGVEIVEVEKGLGLIIVHSSKTLCQIPWLRLVELMPSRYLLIIPSGTSVDSLEISILDLIERLSGAEIEERKMLSKLRNIFKSHRSACSVSKGELLFVNTRTQ